MSRGSRRNRLLTLVAGGVTLALLTGCSPSPETPPTETPVIDEAPASSVEEPSATENPVESVVLPDAQAICALSAEELTSAFEWSGFAPTTGSITTTLLPADDAFAGRSECWYEHGEESTKYEQQIFSLALTAEPYATTREDAQARACAAYEQGVAERGAEAIGGCEDVDNVPVVFGQGQH